MRIDMCFCFDSRKPKCWDFGGIDSCFLQCMCVRKFVLFGVVFGEIDERRAVRGESNELKRVENMWTFIIFDDICLYYNTNKDDFHTKIRFNKHITFLKLLGDLYPFEKFKVKYKKIIKESDLKQVLNKRCLFKRWFYKVDKSINDKCPSYKERCENIELYRANCKKKTCRKKV